MLRCSCDRAFSKISEVVSLTQINYRRCISCRRVGHKKSFWRVVRLASSGEIQLDRGIGRSAYLCPNIECWTKARSKNRLQASLRTKVDDRIYQSLKERLSQSRSTDKPISPAAEITLESDLDRDCL